ncbi:UDP-glycosyltransferase 79B6-like [Mangifera indica]|uniref:UDP-glycosyltransferase 79B6-like n=1 Tax=Mangifera indica TaxID=29780 RepID=UPI001CF98516|nr:UDP-glycosyltransferase 79B6-like [Mangifera indica]
MSESKPSKFHILMFPWFAIGHITPFLHLSNKLAEKGHTITFLLPAKVQKDLQHSNLHPNFITLHPLTIPHVDGLPPGAATASDISLSLHHLLVIAMDGTRDQVELVIKQTKPRLVFYDFSYWIPEITKPLGIKTIFYSVVSAASIAIALVPARNVQKDKPITEDELQVPPIGYPSSTVVLRRHEARALSFISFPFGEGVSFYIRVTTSMKECDVISMRTCRETEGNFCDYIASQYNKPVFLTGPVLIEPTKTPLEDRWVQWLGGFQPGSVVYCAFGSQYNPKKEQFQELLMGFELTGLPFLIASRPPIGAPTVEEAFPEGFDERTKGRGVIWGGWIQQPMILAHPSVGCFVNHCGFGSMWESLMSDCQIVLVPQLGDQILNSRIMAEELKVGVEVEREENGWFSKENLCKAIKSVMEEESEVGNLVRKNHAKWKDLLVNPLFANAYIDKFIKDIQELVGK